MSLRLEWTCFAQCSRLSRGEDRPRKLHQSGGLWFMGDERQLGNGIGTLYTVPMDVVHRFEFCLHLNPTDPSGLTPLWLFNIRLMKTQIRLPVLTVYVTKRLVSSHPHTAYVAPNLSADCQCCLVGPAEAARNTEYSKLKLNLSQCVVMVTDRLDSSSFHTIVRPWLHCMRLSSGRHGSQSGECNWSCTFHFTNLCFMFNNRPRLHTWVHERWLLHPCCSGCSPPPLCVSDHGCAIPERFKQTQWQKASFSSPLALLKEKKNMKSDKRLTKVGETLFLGPDNPLSAGLDEVDTRTNRNSGHLVFSCATKTLFVDSKLVEHGQTFCCAVTSRLSR